MAAATTSLPESIGGDRNWDYRYTWVRDASFTLQALATASCDKEKGAFFGFLARAAATQLQRGVDLQVMYGIGGERDLSETAHARNGSQPEHTAPNYATTLSLL
ncbi:glycoside hydrolase family 15 protein [Streptomyces sp. RKAG293]|uniref:glycoside hydrolase family 15 protein n=1 Tax=Streptomyces sp. RKAG293 TaxID=2893403 RepID=UPI00203479F1|nr:glycoside hydrolase family 15 protein [Streptomyces sp. RKAG293]MCM2419128.1 glycoside hydrolase family 15 protein [Streptomyces sp. RKAG293]